MSPVTKSLPSSSSSKPSWLRLLPAMSRCEQPAMPRSLDPKSQCTSRRSNSFDTSFSDWPFRPTSRLNQAGERRLNLGRETYQGAQMVISRACPVLRAKSQLSSWKTRRLRREEGRARPPKLGRTITARHQSDDVIPAQSRSSPVTRHAPQELMTRSSAPQAPAFRLEIGAQAHPRRHEVHPGVRCCSMYWRMMLIGAPPHEDAK